MKNKQEKVEQLLKLIQENPDLEIMPMVDYEVACSDEYRWWTGSWGEASIDEYWKKDERIYFRSDDEEELIDDVICELNNDLTGEEAEEKAKEIVKGYDWTKAIIVRIETP